MTMISRRQCVFSLGMLPLALASGSAAPAKGTPTLNVALSDAAGPYSWGSGSRTLGIMPTLLRCILIDRLGWDAAFRAYPWKRAQRLVESGHADAFCTYPTEHRRQYVLFSETPITVQDIGYLFFNPSNPRALEIAGVTRIEDLSSFTMAAVVGTEWEEENIPAKVRRITVSNFEIAYHLVKAGRADFLVHSPTQIRFFECSQNISEGLISRPASFLNDHVLHYHFGIRRSMPRVESLIRQFDEVQRDLIGSDEYEQLWEMGQTDGLSQD